MVNYLKITRPINLLIIGLTMVFIRYFYFIPNCNVVNIDLITPTWKFISLVVSTILIAAGGNVVNDILDVQSDKLNKVNKVFIGKSISKKNGWFYYTLLNISGLTLAVLACNTNKIPILISVFFIGLLYLYSKNLKKLPFVSNIVVAGIIAFVPYYVFLFDVPPTLYLLKQKLGYDQISANLISQQFQALLFFLMQMIFFINISREILKDIQDIEGDKASNIKTLPQIYGKKNMRRIASLFLVLMVVLMFFSPWLNERIYASIYFKGIIGSLLTLVAFLIYTNISLKKASNYLKILMLLALIYFPLFTFIFGHHDV